MQGKEEQQEFDFMHDIREEEARKERQEVIDQVLKLPFFENPQNQKEQYFNLQREYYLHNNPDALNAMCKLISNAAIKIIKKITFEKKLIFSKEKLLEFADDASFYFIEQILKNKLVIKDSFIAYLYLQCNKAVFGLTLSERFEIFLNKSHIDLAKLSDFEKMRIRFDFENSIGIEHQFCESQNEIQPTLWS